MTIGPKGAPEPGVVDGLTKAGDADLEEILAPAPMSSTTSRSPQLGRVAEAQQVFERILSLNPNDNQGVKFC